MARAYWDDEGQQWVASFRGLGMVKKQKRRVRLDRARFPKKAKRAADALSVECDRYCRTLEMEPRDPADIEHAARIKAITEDQAARLRASLPPGPATKPTKQWTLVDAARAHPSTMRDERVRPKEAALNLKHLAAFTAFAGYETVVRATLADVMRWVGEMKAKGLSWEARRHRLLYLRRACRMGLTMGIPDPLAGLRIDHREEGDGPAVEAWTLEELVSATVRLTDPRALAALGLGGFVGLRPSECQRLTVGDLAGDVLEVGARKAKNAASRRTLVLPATVARWCSALAKDQKPEAPLIVAHAHRHQPRAFTEMTWSQWLRPILAKATGRDLPPKCLRKSFITWAPGVIAGRDVERFAGHTSAFLAQVSSARYQGGRAAEELRPAAKALEAAIQAAIRRQRLRKVATKSQAKS